MRQQILLPVDCLWSFRFLPQRSRVVPGQSIWSNEWGKLLRIAATTNALSQYQSSVVIYSDIFSEYTPLELMVLEILVCTLICTFVGVLMFFLSLYMNKIIAVAGGLALAIALFPVLNMHPLIRYKLAKFIPTGYFKRLPLQETDVCDMIQYIEKESLVI